MNRAIRAGVTFKQAPLWRSTSVMKWLLLAVVLSMSVFVAPVYADSIGPNGCSGNGCFGGIWTLQYAPTATADIFQIIYTVDTSGMTTFGPITQIAFKVSSSIDSISLVSSPGTWGTNVQGNIGASQNGCSSGGSGFACSTGDNSLAIGSLTYQWVFLVDVDLPLMTGPLQASIKANGTGQGQVLSQAITLQPVPEPGTLLLVGSALAGIGAWRRRRGLGRTVE